jgi:CheY-like chemotaxis protein
VISDIGMPEIDGYQFARLLRNEPGMEGVVLVALTGYGQDSDRERAITAGFDRHLVKPAGVQDLEQLLASLPAAPTRSEGPPQVGAPRPAAVGTFK